MAGGALMQLVAHGVQDTCLTGNPTITYFKQVYKKHTAFACESILQTAQGQLGAGSQQVFTVSRNGDQLCGAQLQIKLPDGCDDDAALGLIQEVSLEIGGQTIQTLTSQYMHIHNELTVSSNHRLKADSVPTAAAGGRRLFAAGDAVAAEVYDVSISFATDSVSSTITVAGGEQDRTLQGISGETMPFTKGVYYTFTSDSKVFQSVMLGASAVPFTQGENTFTTSFSTSTDALVLGVAEPPPKVYDVSISFATGSVSSTITIAGGEQDLTLQGISGETMQFTQGVHYTFTSDSKVFQSVMLGESAVPFTQGENTFTTSFSTSTDALVLGVAEPPAEVHVVNIVFDGSASLVTVVGNNNTRTVSSNTTLTFVENESYSFAVASPYVMATATRDDGAAITIVADSGRKARFSTSFDVATTLRIGVTGSPVNVTFTFGGSLTDTPRYRIDSGSWIVYNGTDYSSPQQMETGGVYTIEVGGNAVVDNANTRMLHRVLIDGDLVDSLAEDLLNDPSLESVGQKDGQANTFTFSIGNSMASRTVHMEMGFGVPTDASQIGRFYEYDFQPEEGNTDFWYRLLDEGAIWPAFKTDQSGFLGLEQGTLSTTFFNQYNIDGVEMKIGTRTTSDAGHTLHYIDVERQGTADNYTFLITGVSSGYNFTAGDQSQVFLSSFFTPGNSQYWFANMTYSWDNSRRIIDDARVPAAWKSAASLSAFSTTVPGSPNTIRLYELISSLSFSRTALTDGEDNWTPSIPYHFNQEGETYYYNSTHFYNNYSR